MAGGVGDLLRYGTIEDVDIDPNRILCQNPDTEVVRRVVTPSVDLVLRWRSSGQLTPTRKWGGIGYEIAPAILSDRSPRRDQPHDYEGVAISASRRCKNA
jgi:hypothetical protein